MKGHKHNEQWLILKEGFMGDEGRGKNSREFHFILDFVLGACIVLFYNEYLLHILKQCKKESQTKTKVCYISIWGFAILGCLQVWNSFLFD